MKIGFDLDNTLINYDRAFCHAASARGLIPTDFTGGKQAMRDHIRSLENGEQCWQALQGIVYGQGITKAELFAGALDCISACANAGHTLFIISHKTEFGHYDETKTNLREAAMGFLERSGLLALIPRENISFHATREEKIAKIREISPDIFIDDLPEIPEEGTSDAVTNQKNIMIPTSRRRPTQYATTPANNNQVAIGMNRVICSTAKPTRANGVVPSSCMITRSSSPASEM